MVQEHQRPNIARKKLMVVNTNALLGATAWGLAVHLIVELLRIYMIYLAARGEIDLRQLPIVQIYPFGAWRMDILLPMGVIIVTDVGIGVLYAILHQREGMLTANDGAGGGSAAATFSHLLTGLLGIGLFWLIKTLLLQESLDASYAMGPVINVLWRWLFILGIGSVLGSVGGVLGTALLLLWKRVRGGG
ncbi:MAG TPA: hypothetical protein VLL52_13115 [Anaerolineae bacterium]|nr:hypothetical protein [Anaerolineae bacterium]